jgi:hypothetical protein
LAFFEASIQLTIDLAIVGIDKGHGGDGGECLETPTLHQCSVFIMAAGAHLTPSLMSALRLCLWDAVLAASDPVWSGFALGVRCFAQGSEVRIGTAIAAVARPLTGTSAVWSLTTVGNTSTFTESTGVLADSTAAGNICN